MFSFSAKFTPVKTSIFSCLLKFAFLSSLNVKISDGSFMCIFLNFLNFRSKSATFSLIFCPCFLPNFSKASNLFHIYYIIYQLIFQQISVHKFKKYTHTIFTVKYIQFQFTKYFFFYFLLEDSMPLQWLVSPCSVLLQLSMLVSAASTTRKLLTLSTWEYLSL